MFHDIAHELGVVPQTNFVSDEALMQQFVETGDRNCFETLMRRYHSEVYSYLRRYLGDDELAEDAFQLTFVRVYQRGIQFDMSRRFRPWLYSIATNQAIDLKRRNKRQPAYSLDAPSKQLGDRETTCAAAIPDHRSAEADQLEQAELREQMKQALELVGEPGRSALELIYLQGMAYRDAAEALNIPVGTVKSRVHAAIRKLGSVWQRIVPQQPER
ncbi:MAG: RNA polymerase sigma factor [Pirellulales bacterium]